MHNNSMDAWGCVDPDDKTVRLEDFGMVDSSAQNRFAALPESAAPPTPSAPRVSTPAPRRVQPAVKQPVDEWSTVPAKRVKQRNTRSSRIITFESEDSEDLGFGVDVRSDNELYVTEIHHSRLRDEGLDCGYIITAVNGTCYAESMDGEERMGMLMDANLPFTITFANPSAQNNVRPAQNRVRPAQNYNRSGERSGNFNRGTNQRQRRRRLPQNIATLGELKAYVRQCYKKNEFPRQHEKKIFRSLMYYKLTVPRGSRKTFDQLWRELSKRLSGPRVVLTTPATRLRAVRDNDAMSTTSSVQSAFSVTPSPSNSNASAMSDRASVAGSLDTEGVNIWATPNHSERNVQRAYQRNSVCFEWLVNFECFKLDCPFKHELPPKAVGRDGCAIPCNRFMKGTCVYFKYPMACRFSHTAGFCESVKEDSKAKHVYIPPSR